MNNTAFFCYICGSKYDKMAFLSNFIQTVQSVFNISDHIDTDAAERSIRSNIFFRGPNAWILAFAIIVASVGLNVNSIPVIIGAMLISPLMGPIFGLGLGLGINDFELLKSAGKNLLVMMLISLVASFIYFLITPLNLTNPTELLARTNPTIYDVLIALCGGFAGIFEQCRKEKGTVFSGVAIATALMPPMCTAGFGLASGNFTYFIGAIYLFIINCLFITLATYLMVKYLKFSTIQLEDGKPNKKAKTISTLLIVIFIIPSIWSAVLLVKQNNFEDRAISFIEANRSADKCILYDYKISHKDGSKIEVFFTGEPLSQAIKNNLIASANEHGISEDQLIISEHATVEDANDAEIVRSIYERTDYEIKKRDHEIQKLKQQLKSVKAEEIQYTQIQKEISLSYPQISNVYITRGAYAQKDSTEAMNCVLVVPECANPLTAEEQLKLTEWLKIRLTSENVVVLPVKK